MRRGRDCQWRATALCSFKSYKHVSATCHSATEAASAGWRYAVRNACFADIRFRGSYLSNSSRSSTPSGPSCFAMLWTSAQGWRRHCGKLGLKSGSMSRPGHSALVGVPSFLKIWNIVSISLSPRKSAVPMAISPRMHPELHISIGSEYSSAPKRISGARYHTVTTSCVYLGMGTEKARAMPKSAIFKVFDLSIKMFCGFKSL
mmetsp:Transcript_24701/g.68894  ORF Transcript_24701/g.68894 Transcript_24701/m.68894 type:complete len:203 (-) Transcript_24701:563-1171(-)